MVLLFYCCKIRSPARELRRIDLKQFSLSVSISYISETQRKEAGHGASLETSRSKRSRVGKLTLYAVC